MLGILRAREDNKENSDKLARLTIAAIGGAPCIDSPQHWSQMSHPLSSGNSLDDHGLLQESVLAYRKVVITATLAPQE